MRKLSVLVACEFSGVVRDAFIARGHDAMSCDLLPSLRPGPHYQGSIFEILARVMKGIEYYDLMLAFWTCTRLCNSGVKHLYIDGKKANGKNHAAWHEMRESALNFQRIYDWSEKIPQVCMENPVMHRYARGLITVQRTQIIQPWMFGHGEIKKTGLYLKNLPPLMPTNVVEGRTPRVHHESPGVKNGLTRAQRRSIFLPGIADAMAEQWSEAVPRG